jgi:hypothetical protein
MRFVFNYSNNHHKIPVIDNSHVYDEYYDDCMYNDNRWVEHREKPYINELNELIEQKIDKYAYI